MAGDEAAQYQPEQDLIEEEDRFAGHLWPRPRYPFLRKLNPRRSWRRRQVRRAVRYEPYGPAITEGAAADYRSITLWHREQQGWPVGKVNYLVCHECRIGYIANIDVQKNLWGNGIATDILSRLRHQLPGYTWQNSRHFPSAKSFWLLIAERTGQGYTDTAAGYGCPHMARFWSRRTTHRRT